MPEVLPAAQAVSLVGKTEKFTVEQALLEGVGEEAVEDIFGCLVVSGLLSEC